MLTHPLLHSRKGFTLVELLVGMTIFSVSMTAILALLHSTIDSAIQSRQEIVASNLLREQVELIKNVRNSNVRNYVSWDTIRTEWVASGFMTGGVYIVENDFSITDTLYDSSNGNLDFSPVYIKDITLWFPPANDLAGRFNKTLLKLDDQNRYNHLTGTGTSYASYLYLSPLVINNGGTLIEPKTILGKNQGFIIDARVIVKSRFGYREYDLKTVITDWKK